MGLLFISFDLCLLEFLGSLDCGWFVLSVVCGVLVVVVPGLCVCLLVDLLLYGASGLF